jgi:hypothetical protein
MVREWFRSADRDSQACNRVDRLDRSMQDLHFTWQTLPVVDGIEPIEIARLRYAPEPHHGHPIARFGIGWRYAGVIVAARRVREWLSNR